jgi:acylpyruvate hydrolase
MGKEFGDMKVVGFNTKEGLHLGVVEGEEVVDLQAVDASAPNDLGEWLRRSARF